MPISKVSSSAMPVDKLRISSPLEAGASLLDSKQLPSHLVTALEYVSIRLVRKRLHLSLIVVRKDVNVPQTPSSPQSPQSSTRPTSLTSSPSRSLFGTASSSITNTLRRVSSRASLSDSSSNSSLPASPRNSLPAFPTSPVSPSFSESSALAAPNPYGITLIHACTLTAKAEKLLRHFIQRAEQKFGIGSGWLSSQSLTTPITCARTNDLIRRSLAQNNVLFSAEGLTLLALDHVYTFKCNLHTYSRTLVPQDFSLAVDELRRLVLAQQGRRITKGYLMRAYDWLGVSLAALVDVNEGYKTAYGGTQRWGGIEVADEERRSPPPLKTDFRGVRLEGLSRSHSGNARPPSPSWGLRAMSPVDKEVAVGESAQGVETLSREDRGPHLRGATTPNAFEDITPVTKGEWLCLMVGDQWKQPKVAAVGTC